MISRMQLIGYGHIYHHLLSMNQVLPFQGQIQRQGSLPWQNTISALILGSTAGAGNQQSQFITLSILRRHTFYNFCIQTGDMYEYLDKPACCQSCTDIKFLDVNVALRNEHAQIHRNFERVWWQFVNTFCHDIFQISCH